MLTFPHYLQRMVIILIWTLSLLRRNLMYLMVGSHLEIRRDKNENYAQNNEVLSETAGDKEG